MIVLGVVLGIAWISLFFWWWNRVTLRYSAKLHVWENERFQLVNPLFAGFDSLSSKLGRSRFTIHEWAKGEVVYHEGTALNYEALVTMVKAVQEQEKARQVVFDEMRKQVGLVIAFERTNPKPDRPKIFGWEFPLAI